MVNQHLAGVHIAAACEAMALGMRAGADPTQLYEVICNSAGMSWMFQNRVPHILDGDYTPLSSVNIFVKDLGIVLDAARKLAVPAAAGGRRAPALPRHRGGRPRQRGRRGGGQVLRRARRPRAAGQGLNRGTGTSMPRFAANLSMMYGEHAFLDRFAAAAADGFDAVEYLFPYDFPAAEIATRLADHGLQQVLFNAPPGDWAAGERGLACLPGREEEFRRGVRAPSSTRMRCAARAST